MTLPHDIPDNEKTGATPSSAPIPRPCESFAGINDREEAALRTEQRGWTVPAVLCILLTAGSFYYYHHKVAQESRAELKVIRADASLRKAYLTTLQEQARLQEQQLATSHTQEGAIPSLKE
jgi:hypothetical protein